MKNPLATRAKGENYISSYYILLIVFCQYSKNKILKDARYSGRDIDGRKVSIAGYVGYIYEEQGERTLQWNDDKYINTIGTDDDMDESELFKMAESMY